uniref:Uncharacterized protein MANES_01G259500 n=1 Tax=Rhizophora mucronata TaxID=61149 RepID=A0A2P2KER3_RHIMU
MQATENNFVNCKQCILVLHMSNISFLYIHTWKHKHSENRLSAEKTQNSKRIQTETRCCKQENQGEKN